MSESENKIVPKIEKINNEVELTRREDMFCRKCVRYFSLKSEFSLHIQKHIEETSGGSTSYMSYIEKYICSTCGKTFEVKSDLIIHHNTVCFQAPYTCKHCKENCENSPLLQMHLLFHHEYSEERLREEGFLADMDENPFLAKAPFMPSPTQNAFQHPFDVEDDDIDFDDIDNATLADTQGTYRTSRRNGRKGKRIAFDLLDKVHSCQICNESFSRKCVLDMHMQKHFMTQKKNRAIRGVLAKPSTLKSCENNCILSRYETQNTESNHASEASRQFQYNTPKSILKPPNVVIGSSIWKKVEPKRYRAMKSSVYTKRSLRSRVAAFEHKEQLKSNLTRSSILNGILKATNVLENATRKRGRPRSLKVSFSSPKALLEVTNGIENPTPKKAKPKSKFQDITVSAEQEGPEASSKNKQTKSGKTKKRKNYPKKAGAKTYACDVCKRRFDDNYKLKRHYFVHTGERPFTCPKCKKKFARDDHLKRHFKRVCGKIDDDKSENH